MRRINFFKVVPTIFLGIGLVMFGNAAVNVVQSLAWTAGTQTTQGTAVAHERGQAADGPGGWAFIAEWTDDQGGGHQTKSDYWTSHPPEMGSQVPVQYDPDDPGRARIATFMGLYLVSVIFGFMGAVFALIGGVILYKIRHEPVLLPGPMAQPEPTTPTDDYHGPVDPPSDPTVDGREQPRP